MPRQTPASASSRSQPRTPATSAAATREPDSAVRFSVQNYAFLAAGAAAAIGGFVMLAGGSTVAAPLLLVLGYGVLIPLGIIR